MPLIQGYLLKANGNEINKFKHTDRIIVHCKNINIDAIALSWHILPAKAMPSFSIL